jgi:hypothetical protein
MSDLTLKWSSVVDDREQPINVLNRIVDMPGDSQIILSQGDIDAG